MAVIKWESDLQAAIELARKDHKPIFLDFWFDG